MDNLIDILFAVIIYGIAFYIGWFIIQKCFSDPIKPIALMILGAIFLLILISFCTGYIPGPLHHGVIVSR